MKYKQIEGTDLNVSRIIMGCMRINSLSTRELNGLIMGELDLGINFFDHADVYAMGGCETAFGKAVDLRSGLRDKMIIQGKCGIRKVDDRAYYDFSKDYIVKATEAILKRLNTEYLDVLLLHRPDSLMEPDEAAEAFSALKTGGKVKYFGVSNFNSMQIELLQSSVSDKLIFNQIQIGAGHTCLFDSGLAANTKFEQGVDRTGSMLEYSRLKKIGLQAWSPLQYGMFEGVILGNDRYEELNAKLEELAEKYNVNKTVIAIAWILRHPAKIQVISGSTKLSHVEDYCTACDIELSRDEWYQIYKAAGNIIP